MQHQDMSSNSSHLHDNELLELAEVAGIRVQPSILRILIELLQMNINPTDLHIVLRNICFRHYSRKGRSDGSHSSRRSGGRKSSRMFDKVEQFQT